jgi:hypothetical protein
MPQPRTLLLYGSRQNELNQPLKLERRLAQSSDRPWFGWRYVRPTRYPVRMCCKIVWDEFNQSFILWVIIHACGSPKMRPQAWHYAAVHGLRRYPAALRELQTEDRLPRRCAGEPAATAIAGSHRMTATSSAECARCRGHGRRQTGWAVIQGIEAIQTTRKGQVLGITRRNLHGQAWVSRRLLGLA